MAIKNARSNTSGNLPPGMDEGEIFIQQADDILFTRKPDGTYRQTLMPKRAGVADTSYTVKRWDTYVGISSLTAPHSIQLPAASAYPSGQPLVIADESGACSTNNQITILPAGNDQINGAVSLPQTAANFGVLMFSDGVSKWTAVQFTANNSAALAASVAAAQSAQTAAESAVASLGQCRLTMVSATQIALNRAGGRLIFVNGAARQIPAPGVTVDNTGLMGSTLYYAYAFMNGANLALEVTATAPAIDPTYGHMVKSGTTIDSTRTLVGAVFPAGATTAAGSYQGGLCTLSFHNRRDIEVTTGVITPSTVSGSWTLLAGSPLQGLCWADEVIDAELTGYGGVGNINAGYYANARIVIGDAAITAASIYGPQSRSGGAAFVSGGLSSRAFSRPGVTTAFASWAQGFIDAGAATAAFNISTIMKTRG